MAAFKARRLVCSARPLITSTIRPDFFRALCQDVDEISKPAHGFRSSTVPFTASPTTALPSWAASYDIADCCGNALHCRGGSVEFISRLRNVSH